MSYERSPREDCSTTIGTKPSALGLVKSLCIENSNSFSHIMPKIQALS